MCVHKIYIFISSSSFSEEKSLRDDEVLQSLPVGTTATMYFRDLGPQLGWTMVRRAHEITDALILRKLRKKSVSGIAISYTYLVSADTILC